MVAAMPNLAKYLGRWLMSIKLIPYMHPVASIIRAIHAAA